MNTQFNVDEQGELKKFAFKKNMNNNERVIRTKFD